MTHVINLSITNSTVPTNMKGAHVIALYKNNGSKSSPSNYRPISILPMYSEILGNTILGIFIDFEKAFDTIDHKFLSPKLNFLYHHDMPTIHWFERYLSSRSV